MGYNKLRKIIKFKQCNLYIILLLVLLHLFYVVFVFSAKILGRQPFYVSASQFLFRFPFLMLIEKEVLFPFQKTSLFRFQKRR